MCVYWGYLNNILTYICKRANYVRYFIAFYIFVRFQESMQIFLLFFWSKKNMTRSSLMSIGPVSIDKTTFANYRFEAHLRQGSFTRHVCFGIRDITCFLDAHNQSLKTSWYNLNKYSITQAIDNGDLFSLPVLEWKILWNKETLRESLQDYVDFLQNHGRGDRQDDLDLNPKTRTRTQSTKKQ